MKPIICNSESVRAILAGRKTQTRRVIKDAPKGSFWERPHIDNGRWYWVANLETPSIEPKTGLVCPYGIPGDSLWVRETFFYEWPTEEPPENMQDCRIVYKASEPNYINDEMREYDSKQYRWSSSIHMPKWASRLAPVIKDVRVERVKDISQEDIKAEGVIKDALFGLGYSGFPNSPFTDERNPAIKEGDLFYGLLGSFAYLWNSINAKKGYDWLSNPWVWVLGLEPI